MKRVAIILSAGQGIRFGSELPKQYIELDGRPVLYYTVNSFFRTELLDGIVVVLNKDYADLVKKCVFSEFEHRKGSFSLEMCEGGKNRQESLYKGVLYVQELYGKDTCVLSHCAARPFVPSHIVEQNITECESGFSVNTVRNVYDTVLFEKTPGDNQIIDRSKTFLTLTPQTFVAEDYINAYDGLVDSGEEISKFTCACSLMKSAGYPMKLIKTDEPIYKLTTPVDLELLKKSKSQYS